MNKSPEKYYEIKYEKVLEHLSDGCSARDACNMALESYTSFRKAVREDPEFERVVENAVAKFKQKTLKKITDSNSWQAAAWILERRFKDEYGKVDMKLVRIEELPKIADNIVSILIEELSGIDIPPDKLERIAKRIQGAHELDPNEYEILDVGKEMSKMTKGQVKKAELADKLLQRDSSSEPHDQLRIDNDILRIHKGDV